MAKEKLVTIHVHTPFTLTLGDQSKQEFGRGGITYRKRSRLTGSPSAL